MQVETQIKLNKFVPRLYQLPIISAIEDKGFRKVIAVLPRRSGKDIVAFNLAMRQCLRKTCTVFYLLPTFSQARRVIWDNITMEGKRLLDSIPPEVIANMNSSEMKITFVNGSILQLVGSDSYDRLVGTNPYACVFSEFALADPRSYQFLRPILTVSGGWVLFVSTPRGLNHFHELWQIAKQNPKEWFTLLLTSEETQHITQDQIQTELREGVLSPDLVEQEYNCSFQAGQEGSYYGKYLDKMRIEGKITSVPYEATLKVHTAWDLGVHDATCIVFFQVVGSSVRIIDCYTNTDKGLDHYAKILNQKPYSYGTHIAPHDIAVRELGSGVSRIETSRNLGINFVIAPNLPIEDGIEATRAALATKVWIDETNCKPLIKALEQYRREWDTKNKKYKDHPLHDWSSDFCFTEEMKVLTPSGNVQINKVKEGDLVITPLGNKKVLKVHKKYTYILTKVTVGKTEIISTPVHEYFTQRGLVIADALRYNDVLEKYSLMRTFLWKKIFGYYIAEQDLKGFKKIILSLKTKSKSCLMATFIDGQRQTILWDQAVMRTVMLLTLVKQPLQLFKGIFGKNTMVRSLKEMLSTIKMEILRIIPLKTLKCCPDLSTDKDMPCNQILGHNHNSVKTYCDPTTIKLKNGIEAKKGESGIRNTLKTRFRFLEKLDIPKNVKCVKENIKQSNCGKSIVAPTVRTKKEFFLALMMKKGIVLFAVKILSAINMISRKHVVRNVQEFRLVIPKEVYDITVENDNCYYINGYLVSNSDAARMLCISLSKTQDSMSAAELQARYQSTVYGDSRGLPERFSDKFVKRF